MSYQEHTDSVVHTHPSTVRAMSSASASTTSNYGWIALGVLVIVIIILIILYVVFREEDGNLSTSGHTWTITENTTGGNVTFAANAGAIFSNRATSNVTLTLTSPSTVPIGQEFIIDNSRGGGTVTIANNTSISGNSGTIMPNNNNTAVNGITITNNYNTTVTSNRVIARGRVAAFIWESSTSVVRLY